MQRFVIFLTALVVAACLATVRPDLAYAGAGGSDGPGGTVTVGVTDGGSGGGGPGGPSSGGGGGGSGGNPWTCTYTYLALNNEGRIAPGGPTPGAWYSVTCINQVTGVQDTQTEWIPDQATIAAPPVDPYSVALQAENSLVLPPPTTHFDTGGTLEKRAVAGEIDEAWRNIGFLVGSGLA